MNGVNNANQPKSGAREEDEQISTNDLIQARLPGLKGPDIRFLSRFLKSYWAFLLRNGKNTKAHVYSLLSLYKANHLLFRRIHNIHQRPGSPLNLAEDDLSLGNLKFVPKGETDKVIGIANFPKDLINGKYQKAPYYNAYLEMQPKPVPSKKSKPAPATKPKVTLEKPSEPSPAKHPKRGKVQKFAWVGKSPLQLIDEMSLETFQAHGQAPVGGVAIRERVEEATRQLLVVEGKGKEIATDEQASQHCELDWTRLCNLQDDASGGGTNIVTANTEFLYAEEVQAVIVNITHIVLEEKTSELECKTSGTGGAEGDKVMSSVGRPQPRNMSTKESSKATEHSHGRDEMRVQKRKRSGSYKSLPEHVALYEALEASMERANRDEFLAKKDKSRKRRRDDQDPPPPPPDSILKQ
ncbi:hypothetical protein Tco_0272798 [Tanacetum coccineum]